MFKILFKNPKSIARFHEAPFADAREQFLEKFAKQGYSHSMLRKIAWLITSVSYSIDFKKEKITKNDIKKAIDTRKHFKNSPQNMQISHTSYQFYIHIVTEWVNSLGYVISNNETSAPFEPKITKFAQYLRDECGLSSITIKTRCERLLWFFADLDQNQKSLRTISISDLDSFIDNKGKNGWKRSSLSALASSLRSFFRYAEGQGWCKSGIAAAIESPRLYVHEGLPKGPHWEDVQRLLNNIIGNSPADIRDKAVLMLLAIYGFRRSEVEQLCLENIDWDNEQILITRPKQLRTQYYPLVPIVGEAILRYLKDARPVCEFRNLFLNLHAPIRPLSASSISAIAHARLNVLDIALSRKGAHCLRHACAGRLLASGFTLKQIGDHLGHRAANSTLIYTKIDLESLRKVAELDLGGLL